MSLGRRRLLGVLLALYADSVICALLTLPIFVSGLIWVGFWVLGGLLVVMAITQLPAIYRGDASISVPDRDPTGGRSLAFTITWIILCMPLGYVIVGLLELMVCDHFTGASFPALDSWADPVVRTVVIPEAMLGLAFGVLLAACLPAIKRRYEEDPAAAAGKSVLTCAY